ncbi:hypothetical protein ACET3Z_032057 [Daucus carota]
MSMSLTSSLVRAPVSPSTHSVYSGVKVKCIAVAKTTQDLPIQVRSKEVKKDLSQKSFTTISRRALATQLAIASLVATTTILPEPAEAQILNPEIKRKIFEKLKWLKEKVGLSKRDTENEEKTSSPAAAAEKEKPLPRLPPSPLPIQTAEAL